MSGAFVADWHRRWWAADYSWDGLKNHKTGGPGETLQDFWAEEIDDLVEFAGRRWTWFHLPLTDLNGKRSQKARWPAQIVSDYQGALRRYLAPRCGFQSGYRARLNGVVVVGDFFMDGQIAGVDLDDCHFGGRLNLSGAAFLGSTNLRQALFSDHAFFRDTRFAGQVNFRDAVFARHANFLNAGFEARAYFWHAQFGEGANFTNTIFNEDVSFSEAAFGANVSFWETVFNTECYFRQTRFETSAFFSSEEAKPAMLGKN